METVESLEKPDEAEVLKRCYKCEHPLLDNLNIVYGANTSLIITWNRFQIFVHEDLNLEKTEKIFIPEFQVHQLLVTNNYLVCLDTSGNIHTTCMKFKNPSQKRFKSSFQPREQSVLFCVQSEGNIVSLKYDSGQYYLCQNKVNCEFSLEKQVTLIYKGRWPLPQPVQEKCLIISHKLTAGQLDDVKTLLNVKKNINYTDSILILMSLDKLTVFACIFSPRMAEEDITLVKLYTCPSEISNFDILSTDQLLILIGLKIGTLVRLSLENVTNKPDFIHLNIALHKFLCIQDTIVYTDGRSMWKAKNIFTDNVSFSQFFVKHVKDFIKFGDQIICTTYSDLIYAFPIEDDRSYMKPETVDEYCSAEKLLNNSEYLHKIIEELEKNSELTKRINEEGNFITALSLSNRQDIMDNIIQHDVTVYDCYENVKAENYDITLTEKINEYFEPHTFQILIKLFTTTLQHVLNDVLTNLFNDVKIHVTLSTENKLLKTTSIKLAATLKKINILMPININNENISEINVIIELISSMPGAFDENQKLWVTLYNKRITLNAEHFIKTVTTNNGHDGIHESVEDLVFNIALAQFGGTYKITGSKRQNQTPEFSVYLKLPENYKQLFKIKIDSTINRSNQIINHCSVDEFLKCNNSIDYEIGDNYVKVEILCDEFTSPMLKVSSSNMAVAVHIRNFFSKHMYDDFKNFKPGKEFVKYVLYNKTENLQKAIKHCMLSQADFREFEPHAENFERDVIGALPL